MTKPPKSFDQLIKEITERERQAFRSQPQKTYDPRLLKPQEKLANEN